MVEPREPRRYTLCLEVEVYDHSGGVSARSDALCLEASGGSDTEVLCNVLQFAMESGWMTEEQVSNVVGRALREHENTKKRKRGYV